MSTAPLAAAAPPSVDGRRILLVEDHGDCAEMIAMVLELNGWQVRIAASAAQARALAEEQAFDVVLGDVALPDGCGLRLLPALREAQRRFGPRPPVAVAMSGYGMPDDRERSLQAGYAAHLLKPVDVDDLMALLRRLLAHPDG
jgi:CheY-like chemotaxis protein